MKKSLKLSLVCLLIGLGTSSLKAQKGSFITLWGGGQLVGMTNFDDFNPSAYNNNLDRNNTYRSAFGLDYIYNFSNTLGLQAGIGYSMQGQRYSGAIDREYNTKDTQSLFFDSHIFIDYYRIPLMFRFNSDIDPDERMNMSIYLGLEVNILAGVKEVGFTAHDTAGNPFYMPDSITNRYPNFDFDKLYKTVNIGMGAGVQFNIRMTQTLYANVGARFSRSFTNAENLNYKFPKDLPAEYVFPVSTLKRFPTDLLTRNKTSNTVINVYAGLSFRLGKKE